MNNMFKSFDKSISWNTKFYVVLAVLIMVFTAFFSEYEAAYLISGVLALLIVLLLDFYLILSKKYTKTWRWMKIVIILIIMALTLISMTN